MKRTNILDTNVLAVANLIADHVDRNCIFNAQRLLNTIVQQKQSISIDNQQLIFNEYKRYANFSGQPNIGDILFKWLFSNFGNADICERVAITPTQEEDILFSEIPSDLEGIDKFDKSDQKFLAVAFGSQYDATIHEAADTEDWNVLPNQINKNNGQVINIEHIC
jgi:hypothetical protein